MRKGILFLLVLFITSLVFAKEYTLSGVKLELSKVKESSYLSSGVLDKSIEIQLDNAKLKLKAGMPVEFDLKKAVLKKAFLDGNHEMNLDGNVIVLKDSTDVLLSLTFSTNKPTLISGHLASDTKLKIANYEFVAKALNDKYQRDITISSKKYILSAVLLNDLNTKVGNKDYTFKAGTRLNFDKEMFGKKYYIRSGTLKSPLKLNLGNYLVNLKEDVGINDENIAFYESSEINFLKIAADVSYKTKTQTIPFKKGGNIFFYKDGIIKSGYLSKDINLKAKGVNKLFKKGRTVYFDKTGEVER